GWELLRALSPLGEVVAPFRGELNLLLPEQVRQVVRDTAPQAIVNAAAYTDVEKAEDEPDLATEVNGTAPGLLAEEAKRLGALMVHYSTEYVFD
ncbi:sugar nucleotide-binding protein, partial [Escherichia coli]